MAIDTKKYSDELHRLCEDYYFHDISHAEYVKRRNDVFNRIEQEITTGVRSESVDRNELCNVSELAEDLQSDQD